MGIYALDIETQSFNPRKFILACLISIQGETQYFTKRKDLWNKLIEITTKEANKGKNGKNTWIYFHAGGSEFDLYATIPNLNDTQLEYIGGNGKKAEYPVQPTEKKGKAKKIIFLDTTALYKGNIKKIGKEINLPKLKTPEKLKKERKQKYSEEEMWEIEKYCKRDTEIVMKLLKMIKEELEGQGINTRGIKTIGNLSLRYFLKEIKNSKHKQQLMEYDWEQKEGKKEPPQRLIKPTVVKLKEKLKSKKVAYYSLKRTKNKTRKQEELMKKLFKGIPTTEKALYLYEKSNPAKAYRGARITAWKTGLFKKVWQYDVRSMYPYCATKIDFPNLSTERTIEKPLETQSLEKTIRNIGTSRAIIETTEDKLGQIPIRLPTTGSVYYPTKRGTLLIGTWTNFELQEFHKKGNLIHNIEATTTFRKLEENPLKKLMKKYYKRRLENKFNNQLYKEMANMLFGKLGQKNKGYKYKIILREEQPKYSKRNWELIGKAGIGQYRIRQKQEETPARNYTPIIPAYVNAYARNIIYQTANQINPEHVLYADTDSLTTIGNKNEHFKIGEELGQWKIEQKNTKARIIGEKHYIIGNKIALAGVSGNSREKAWTTGKIQYNRLNTIKTAKTTEQIGKITKRETNLEEIANLRQEKIENAEQEKLIYDKQEKEQPLDYKTLLIIKQKQDKTKILNKREDPKSSGSSRSNEYD